MSDFVYGFMCGYFAFPLSIFALAVWAQNRRR